MLLGLLAAVMLAVLLQLNAGRSRRSDPFDFAADGTIDLRCWVVVETPIRVTCRPILALPAPRRLAEPLRFVGERRMLRRLPARRPLVRTPPDAIIIPGDILPARVVAEEISASHWQSPPGNARAPVFVSTSALHQAGPPNSSHVLTKARARAFC